MQSPAEKPTKTGEDYDRLDLNKMNDDELTAHKAKMDEGFYKHYKDPKSKNFVYDVEVPPQQKHERRVEELRRCGTG